MTTDRQVLDTTTNTTELISPINDDMFHSFMQYIDVKDKSLETYTRSLKQFFNYITVKGITEPTRQDIVQYRETLKADKQPATVQLYMIAVKQFFKWTDKVGIYPNIADNVKGVSVSKGMKKDYLTTGQVKDVLSRIDTETVKGKRDYAIIALMVTCGLRDIEVSRANVSDLRTRQNSTVLYIQGKGKDDRESFVVVPDSLEKVIRDYLKSRGGNSEALFTSNSNHGKGDRLTTRSISRIVKTAMINAGLDSDRLTAHSLRHTAVTQALIAGQTLQEVQQFARHSNINTTLIYAHNLENEKNECSGKLADMFL